jgi:hypothetical protein
MKVIELPDNSYNESETVLSGADRTKSAGR